MIRTVVVAVVVVDDVDEWHWLQYLRQIDFTRCFFIHSKYLLLRRNDWRKMERIRRWIRDMLCLIWNNWSKFRQKIDQLQLILTSSERRWWGDTLLAYNERGQSDDGSPSFFSFTLFPFRWHYVYVRRWTKCFFSSPSVLLFYSLVTYRYNNNSPFFFLSLSLCPFSLRSVRSRFTHSALY